MEIVYVANLPPDIRIKDIDDFFSPFGKVCNIDVNRRAIPVYAYVRFDSARNAFNAVKSRHGYDYEGYTLQLRLIENEVRNRREVTPPPPPPSMFNKSYERQNDGYNRMGDNFNNSSFQSNSSSLWSNNNRSGMEQQQQNVSAYSVGNRNDMDYSTNNWSNSQQQSLMPYSSNVRSNMQQYSNTNRDNMRQQYSGSDMQQQYSNTNRDNMDQQYSGSDMQQQYSGSNMQQQYSGPSMQQQHSGSNMQQQYYGSNMQQQYSNYDRSNMQQQNINYPNQSEMMNYSNTNNTNMQHNRNMTNYSNNSSFNGGNNMGWDIRNYSNDGNNYDNFRSNDDKYTRNLSNSERRLFNRFIREGFSPKTARIKVFEFKGQGKNLQQGSANAGQDDTNVALETIGNTILSLLSTNSVDIGGRKNNNRGGGQSSSNARGNVASQTPPKEVSRREFLRAADNLKALRFKRVQSAKDRLAKRQYMQIVKNYKDQKSSVKPEGNNLTIQKNTEDISKLSEEAMSLKLRKKKRQLMAEALRHDDEKTHSGAFRKRKRFLMDAGFDELDSKVLGVLPIEKLKSIVSLKKDYDMAIKKTEFIPADKRVYKQVPKIFVYRNDINYLKSYEQQKFSTLSLRIKRALKPCIDRIHAYEKESGLPLTKTKFTHLLARSTITSTIKKEDANKKDSNVKQAVDQNKTKPSTTNADKKKENIKNDDTNNSVDKAPIEKANTNENAENQNNEKIDDGDDGEFNNAENPESEADKDENEDRQDEDEQ